MAGILHQIAGGRVPAKADAILYALLSGDAAGICNGCEVTASGKKLYISPGFGIIQGRSFTITDTEIDAKTSPGGTTDGRLLLQVDTSKTASTGALSFITQVGEFPDLIQEDINNTAGIYQIVLATYTANEISVLTVATEKYDMTVPHDWLYTAVFDNDKWTAEEVNGYSYVQEAVVTPKFGAPAFSNKVNVKTFFVNKTGTLADDSAMEGDASIIAKGYHVALNGRIRVRTTGIPGNCDKIQVYFEGGL